MGEATGRSWFGFCTPVGLRAPITERWVSEPHAALALSVVAERLASLGVEGTSWTRVS